MTGNVHKDPVYISHLGGNNDIPTSQSYFRERLDCVVPDGSLRFFVQVKSQCSDTGRGGSGVRRTPVPVTYGEGPTILEYFNGPDTTLHNGTPEQPQTVRQVHPQTRRDPQVVWAPRRPSRDKTLTDMEPRIPVRVHIKCRHGVERKELSSVP